MWQLINRLYKILKGDSLNLLELRIFEEIIKHSETNTALLIEKQLNAINKVTRDPGGLESLFYHIQGDKPVRCSDISIKNKEEHLYAVLKVLNPSNNEILKIKVWAINGHIFMFQYNKNYKTLLNKSSNSSLVLVCIKIAPLH